MKTDQQYMARYYTVMERKAVNKILVPHGEMARAMQRSRYTDGFRATIEWWDLTASPSQLKKPSTSKMEAKDQGGRGREMLDILGVGIPVDAQAEAVAPASKVCLSLELAEPQQHQVPRDFG